MSELFLEDLEVGRKFETGTLTVDVQAIKAFAAEYDPQPHHLDDEAARRSVFEGVTASGWHTTALSMRLLVKSAFQPAGGIVGVRTDELYWPRPVRPGDELHVLGEVLEVRRSATRAERGYVKFRTTTLNQRGEPVQVLVMNLLVRARA